MMKSRPIVDTGERQGGEVLSRFVFKAAALTDRGKRRRRNEDTFVFVPERGFFAVSDGMGGLAAGSKAAAIIAEVLPKMLKGAAAAAVSGGGTPQYAGDCLADCVSRISDNISAYGNRNGVFNWFGATIVGLWLVGDAAVFVNLGDSRGYLLPARGCLRQITRDHSIVALLLEEGEITPEEAVNHPAGGQLTRYAGMSPPALPEIFIEKIRTGDRLLLCSDGLTGMVADAEIAGIMNSGARLEEICRMLVDTANARGGRDNITVMLLEIAGINPLAGVASEITEVKTKRKSWSEVDP